MSVLDYVMGMKSAGAGGGSTGGGLFVVRYDSEAGHADKTWNEVKDAAMSGKTVALVNDEADSYEYTILTQIEHYDGGAYSVYFGSNLMYTPDDPDDYLIYSD